MTGTEARESHNDAETTTTTVALRYYVFYFVIAVAGAGAINQKLGAQPTRPLFVFNENTALVEQAVVVPLERNRKTQVAMVNRVVSLSDKQNSSRSLLQSSFDSP